MVVGAFPAIKLGVLAFKQLSKPVANIMKERAKHSPFFRRYICMPPAQFYNWVEVTTKMWALNMGKPTKVPQLNEAMAIELGANLLGEIIIFTIGAGLLIFEYMRQANKEMVKEEQFNLEKRQLYNTINELSFNLERHDAQIRHLSRTVAELESRKWLPKLKILKSKDDGDNGTEIAVSNTVPVSPESPVVEQKGPIVSHVTGNYNDSNESIVSKSINLIENEVFFSNKESFNDRQEHRIIQDALIYLNYSAYN